MYDLVSLGEIMLRLSPPKYERLSHAATLDVRPCGAQFNIAANMASLGRRSAFLTRLPEHEMGLLAKVQGQKYGVDMSHVRLVDGGRIGIIYVEFSVAPHRHIHIYDRGGSAASTILPDDFDWGSILRGAQLAFVDGIMAGLSESCFQTTLRFIQEARQAGCKVCFDVNYRESLWTSEQAQSSYRAILPQVDLLVTNRTVAERLFGFSGGDVDLLRAHHNAFGCEVVCLTYREMEGILRGRWRSLALHGDQVVEGRPFEFDVVDRFGTGDAFFAGFLHRYLECRQARPALDFGNAMCALAHTIDGDPAPFSAGEVDALLHDDYTLTTKR